MVIRSVTVFALNMHVSNVLVPLLAMCFTSFISHGFLPESMLSVLLVFIPVTNDKAVKISSKDNDRPKYCFSKCD